MFDKVTQILKYFTLSTLAVLGIGSAVSHTEAKEWKGWEPQLVKEVYVNSSCDTLMRFDAHTEEIVFKFDKPVRADCDIANMFKAVTQSKSYWVGDNEYHVRMAHPIDFDMDFIMKFNSEKHDLKCDFKFRREFKGSAKDSDKDGLEDALEKKLGTSILRADTDKDGLSDYAEYCKYRTNPMSKDSDNDGKPDGDWEERREFTYSIKALLDLWEPFSLESMNDIWQDARLIRKKDKKTGYTRFEVVLYPDAKPHTYLTEMPLKNIPEDIKRFTETTPTLNYTPEMQEAMQNHIKKEAWMRTDYFATIGIVFYRREHFKEPIKDGHKRLKIFGNKVKILENGVYKDIKDLDNYVKDAEYDLNLIYADAMWKNKITGSCTPRSTITTALLRAGGIPARRMITVPLLYYAIEDQDRIFEEDPNSSLKEYKKFVFSKTPDSEGKYKTLLGEEAPIVSHWHPEVYLSNNWIRFNNALNDGIEMSKERCPYVKILGMNEYSDFKKWELPYGTKDGWPLTRPFKLIKVSEQKAIH